MKIVSELIGTFKDGYYPAKLWEDCAEEGRRRNEQSELAPLNLRFHEYSKTIKNG